MDALVVYALIFLGVLIVSANDLDPPLTAVPGIILLYISALAYGLLADGLPGGQSLGKRVLKMRVIKAATGKPCKYGDSLVRNLLLGILGPVDWLFIFSAKRQRLGDRAAGTLVLKTNG